MTAFCLTVCAAAFVAVVIGLNAVTKPSREMTKEELENYQQQLQQMYEPILDAIDPQRIEEKRQEKLMNDYEYYLLMGELPPRE